MSVSVIIPTLNAATDLPACLNALIPGAVEGLIKEVIIADGGSTDKTLTIADSVGARLCMSEKGRGFQLRAGARLARGDWLLFLHADTVLSSDWLHELNRFLDGDGGQVGVFRLRFDEKGIAPSMVAIGAMFRTYVLAAPYGDQGLVISRKLYDEIGGFSNMPLMEDVDIIQRLRRAKGRQVLKVFNSPAITSAKRYRKEGYLNRVVRNFCCIMMYRFGMPLHRIVRFYEADGH